MNNAGQILPDLRITCELKTCRSDPGRRHINMQRRVEIARPQTIDRSLLFSNRKLWVKYLCGEGFFTVPFAIQPYARLGSDIMQKHRLTPAGMGQNHIWSEKLTYFHRSIKTALGADNL